ncbi:hypothetical protein FBU59_002535 [Linderina macrospora]|uniref:Uncharacterized protein n=1 Tax=Linderina macrospora TaxID=4868 RepID=A0ACC1JAW1_9FUNG|nr:hypothetical protein FBU59_002535 [Linderina macrospora]
MAVIKNSALSSSSPSTQVVHGADHLRVLPDVAEPISMSTTYEYAEKDVDANNYGPDQFYVYSREGTATMAKAEASLSILTEGHVVLYGSGLSAALAVLVELKPKKIALGQSYFGVKDVIEQYQGLVAGVEVVGIDDSYEGVDLVWSESPINPTGEILDLAHYAKCAHAVGAKLVVDSTFAPPPLSYPFRQGVDIVVHSATKYMGGHSDLLAGVIVVKTPEMADHLRHVRGIFGLTAGNMEAWLLLRSLKTLPLRVIQQAKTTQLLVNLLESYRKTAVESEDHAPTDEEAALGGPIQRVQYASLQTFDSSFDVKAQYPLGFGAVFSLDFMSKEQALFVARQLKLHAFATSLGGVESLVDWRYACDANAAPTLLRVSVGLESFEDLAADWKQALLALHEHEKARTTAKN